MGKAMGKYIPGKEKETIMKKRIVTIALVVALVAIAAVGTLAYFTDVDVKENVFTTGKVDITLNDEFEQNSKLVPATVDAKGNISNYVDKVVSVTNEDDSEEAYVRVHMAIPTSIRNMIGLWRSTATNWDCTGTGDTRNDTPDYITTIDGVEYAVFVYTYTEKLAAGETTSQILDAVTMEPWATNEQVEAVNGSFKIIIFAEGTQAAGFSDAATALEAAFGTPTAAKNPWNNYTEAAE